MWIVFGETANCLEGLALRKIKFVDFISGLCTENLRGLPGWME
jgi:hypothetical protein